MSKSTVKPCECKHESQDQIYGKGLRLHNNGKKAQTYKCTACGKKK